MNETDILELLPDLSDETAYHLSNFVMELALLLESHYFGQIKRYLDDYRSCDPSTSEPQENNIVDDDITF